MYYASKVNLSLFLSLSLSNAPFCFLAPSSLFCLRTFSLLFLSLSNLLLFLELVPVLHCLCLFLPLVLVQLVRLYNTREHETLTDIYMYMFLNER